jgi:K+-sensing histidine kinase KdpD
LGLYISGLIAKAHNGWIEVTTTPEKGSRFSLWLPAGGLNHSGENRKRLLSMSNVTTKRLYEDIVN